MTKQNLSYLAGIIDGEGSINISLTKSRQENRSPEYRARLYVVNTEPVLIEWIKTRFGGLTYKRPDKVGKWRTRYEWVLPVTKNNTLLLRQIIPYLVIKKKQAKNMLEFVASTQSMGKKLTKEILAKRQKLFEKNRILNLGSNND